MLTASLHDPASVVGGVGWVGVGAAIQRLGHLGAVLAQVTALPASRFGIQENVMMRKKRANWRRRGNHRADSARLCGHEEEPSRKEWKITRYVCKTSRANQTPQEENSPASQL